MLTLLIIFANAAFAIVKADLVVKPRDTEAMIGDSIYFDCASNVDRNEVHWLHYAVGAKDHEDICVYCLGTVHPQYDQRIEVERNLSTGNFQLRFKSVQRQDAGRYLCEDNGGIGESASAELVILESIPTCTSNMKSDGLLGPNSCGLEPDMLHLSCHVSYHGNIPPVIKWRKTETEDPVNPLFCQNIGNQMTCNLTMTVDLGLNGVSYICETNRSTTQYSCVLDMIHVLYVKSSNLTKEMIEGTEEEVTCSVKSSQSCIHIWRWFDGVHEEIVANGSALVTHKPGWYKCESQCNIRGKQCTVLSRMVHIAEQKDQSISVKVAIAAIILPTLGLAVIGICLIYRKRITKKCIQYFCTRNKEPVLDSHPETRGNPEKILVENFTIHRKVKHGLQKKSLSYSNIATTEFDRVTPLIQNRKYLKEVGDPWDTARRNSRQCQYSSDYDAKQPLRYTQVNIEYCK